VREEKNSLTFVGFVTALSVAPATKGNVGFSQIALWGSSEVFAQKQKDSLSIR
jgi:hypothetical protein